MLLCLALLISVAITLHLLFAYIRVVNENFALQDELYFTHSRFDAQTERCEDAEKKSKRYGRALGRARAAEPYLFKGPNSIFRKRFSVNNVD
jgi:hypothetical protein